MQHVRIKSASGWEEKELEAEELCEWFSEHSKDGVVEDEIMLFTEATFDVTKDAVSWVMSDMSLDRDMERVDPAGCDMKAYKKNPVVLWSHDHSTPAIGKCNNPKFKDGQIVGNVEFDSAQNDPFAGMIAGKVKAGIINAGSIGFKPQRIEFIDPNDPNSNPKDPTKLIHRKWELMEFSICNVPANANARPMESMSASKPEEKVVETPKEKRSLIAELLSDRSETSLDLSQSTAASGSVEAMFPSESSGGSENGLGLMFEERNNDG